MIKLAAAFYEHPAIVALGPELSALISGFAVIWNGELHLTPLGQMYLEQRNDHDVHD